MFVSEVGFGVGLTAAASLVDPSTWIEKNTQIMVKKHFHDKAFGSMIKLLASTSNFICYLFKINCSIVVVTFDFFAYFVRFEFLKCFNV